MFPMSDTITVTIDDPALVVAVDDPATEPVTVESPEDVTVVVDEPALVAVVTNTAIETVTVATPGPPGPPGPPGIGGGAADLAAHVVSPTPHPFYDDQPSLVLIYENRIV